MVKHSYRMIRIAVLFTLFLCGEGFLDGPWDHDVYSGRHWNDLVTDSTSTASTIKGPCFLALYKPECEKHIIQRDQLVEANFPPQQYITFGKYDTETVPKYVWYAIDYTDNLTQRYKPTECLEYIYFPDGGNLYNPERYDSSSGVDVLEWVWSKMAQRFTVKNDRSNTIKVDIRGHKDVSFTVEPGKEVGFTSYISSIISVTEPSTGTFVHGYILDKTISTLPITTALWMPVDHKDWLLDTRRYIKEINNRAREWRWAIAVLYLTCFKQPVLLPTLTNVGYKVRQIPKVLFDEVIRYYNNNQESREIETLHLEPAINQDSVRTTMVHLDAPMSERIAEYITPMIEDWVSRKMELTRMYGIREFHRGNILRPHVARVGAQVASAILVIAKDLDGEPDWDFQVTLYDGTRKPIRLNAGQMIFFESATLIHGFPNPFEGNDYALVFIHFRPVDDWTWDIHPDGHWIMNDGNPQECIDQLITPKTYMKATKGRTRDEL